MDVAARASGTIRVLAAACIGWLAYRVGWRLRVVRRNLARHKAALGIDEAGVEALARAHYTHLGRALVTTAALPAPAAALHARAPVALPKALLDELSEGGVIVCSAHLGLWELALPLVAAALSPRMRAASLVVYKPLHAAALDAWLRARRATAAKVPLLPARGSWRALLGALEAGGVVGLVPDQRPGPGRGRAARFLGAEALFDDGIGRLHEATGAPVWLVLAVCREGGAREGLDVSWTQLAPRQRSNTPRTPGDAAGAVVERYAAALERAVVQHPAQYLWVHDRWKDVPAPGVEMAA